MLDDFRKSSTTEQARKRLGSSLAIALVLYGGGGAAIVYATAGIQPKAEEELEQVEFAPPPEPEPEPEEVKPATPEPAKPKPKPKKPKLDVPKEISQEILKESDAELAEAGDVGPIDGTGSDAAPPPPPPPPPKKAGPVTKPVDSGSNRYDRLKYPPAAQRKGIEGAVVVSFDVLENGTVGNARIVSGPAEFHEVVLKAASGWRFTPAKQDGKAVRYKNMTKRVVFRLEDA
jgi:periplasmic protein TonB